MSFTQSSECSNSSNSIPYYYPPSPSSFQNNFHYYSLNTQLKIDLEQQNAIKMQQLEAIKLIQLSIDKLSATTTVPLNNHSSKSNSSPPPPTILVYKETNLHKNLLVSKILNKARHFYYQSVVQTMRLSLMSKLNYYSNLIQQMNNNKASNINENKTDLINNNNNQLPLDDNVLLDEMKLLMQQIINESYQFNLNCNLSNQLFNNESDHVKNISQSSSSNIKYEDIASSIIKSNNKIVINDNDENRNNIKTQVDNLIEDNNNVVKCGDLTTVKRFKRCLDNNNNNNNDNHESDENVNLVLIDENNNAILTDETNVVNRNFTRNNNLTGTSNNNLNTKNHPSNNINSKRFKAHNFAINKLKSTSAINDNLLNSSTSTNNNDIFHQVLV